MKQIELFTVAWKVSKKQNQQTKKTMPGLELSKQSVEAFWIERQPDWKRFKFGDCFAFNSNATVYKFG